MSLSPIPPQTRHSTRRRSRAVGLFVFALAIVFVWGCDREPTRTLSPTKDESTAVEKFTVTFAVDFGDRTDAWQTDYEVPANTTIFELMSQLRQRDHLDFDSSGSGETAFIKSINGIANEGAQGPNWIYRVNDELIKRSCGVVALKSGDRVEWRFGKTTPEELNE